MIKPASTSFVVSDEPSASLVGSMDNMKMADSEGRPENDPHKLLEAGSAASTGSTTASAGSEQYRDANTSTTSNDTLSAPRGHEARPQTVLHNPLPSIATPSGGIGWDDDEPKNPISAPAKPAQGGIGWDDLAPAQAANSFTNNNQPVQRQFNNSYHSNLDDASSVQPSDSISNVDGSDHSRSTVNGMSNGGGRAYNHSSGNGYGAANGGSYGQSGAVPRNAYNNYSSTSDQRGYTQQNGSGSYNSGYTNGCGNTSGNGLSNGYNGQGIAGTQNQWGAPRTNTFESGQGGNGHSGGGGYGGGGNYSYGPPVERRFPGPGGSWASGPNEIPLRHNRWQTQGGRRPGDDVYRPAVSQAIPGSGW